MKLQKAIQSANLHSHLAHARAKADAVEAPPSKPKRWRLERGMVVEGEWEPHPTRGKSIRTIAKVHGECLADFEENGLLLAAAPELLDALERVLLAVKNAPGCGQSIALNAIEQAASSAIAKAKKGQQ